MTVKKIVMKSTTRFLLVNVTGCKLGVSVCAQKSRPLSLKVNLNSDDIFLNILFTFLIYFGLVYRF